MVTTAIFLFKFCQDLNNEISHPYGAVPPFYGNFDHLNETSDDPIQSPCLAALTIAGYRYREEVGKGSLLRFTYQTQVFYNGIWSYIQYIVVIANYLFLSSF